MGRHRPSLGYFRQHGRQVRHGQDGMLAEAYLVASVTLSVMALFAAMALVRNLV